MTINEFATYAFYDNKGRRLAIFYDDRGTATIIPCSKKDQFSKKVARAFYEGEVLPPSAMLIGMTPNMTQREFINYCDHIFKRLKKKEQVFNDNCIILDVKSEKLFKLTRRGTKVTINYLL